MLCLKKCLYAPTQDVWPNFVDVCVFHHNASVQASLQESPNCLMHSFAPRLPVHNQLGIPPLVPAIPLPLGAPNPCLAPAHGHLQQAQQRQILHHNRCHRVAVFSPGDLVLVRDLASTPGLSKKLCAQFHGPYAILAKCSDVNYELKIADHGAKQTTIVHVANLCSYIPRHPVLFLPDMSPGLNHLNADDQSSVCSAVLEGLPSQPFHAPVILATIRPLMSIIFPENFASRFFTSHRRHCQLAQ